MVVWTRSKQNTDIFLWKLGMMEELKADTAQLVHEVAQMSEAACCGGCESATHLASVTLVKVTTRN